MEKRKSYSIKEISRLLNIPKATIRYWDNEGLIAPERNKENDYREFSLAVAMELSNISFYRSIDIPLKELRQMLQSDIQMQEEVLIEAEKRLEQKQLELKRQAERIRTQRQALEEIRRLKKLPLMPGKPVFKRVAAFSYQNEKHWQKMVEDPGTFVLVFEEEGDSEYQYGIGYKNGEKSDECEEIIWEYSERKFWEGLLITDNRDEGKNDLTGKRESARRAGMQTGRVIAQYLTSGGKGEDNLWDYYKMWLEIL